MVWFDAFRNGYGFSLYSDYRTSVTYDVPLLTVIYLCVLLSIATLIATLGIRGRERWFFTIRAIYAVAIGSIILACLVGYGWQEGSIKIKSAYVYRNNLPFEGYVSIKVGLESVNVTLDGNYRSSSGSGYVFYAESVPSSSFGHESKAYSHFLRKGLPEPILRVMEFLTVDEGSFRWGRSFQISGYFTFALLCTSFAFWVISNVLLCSVIIYGAYMFTLTGLTMILACVTYHVCQCSLRLTITFTDQTLTIAYSWCYWLTLAAGCMTFLLGVILIVLDHVVHADLIDFFHLEKLVDDDAFENEYRQDNNKYLVTDRRGSVVPYATDRRESIFLDPCRQPISLVDRMKNSFQSGNAVFTIKATDKSGAHSKKNPLYNENMMIKSASNDIDEEDEVRVHMEKVCEDCDVCTSTKKPSLATLKEHRDNHANERRSSISNAETPSHMYTKNAQRDRRIGSQGRIFTFDSLNSLNVSFDDSKNDICRNDADTSDSEEQRTTDAACEPDERTNKSLNYDVVVSLEYENRCNIDSPRMEYNSLTCPVEGSQAEVTFFESDSEDQIVNSSESTSDRKSPSIVVDMR